MEEKVILTQVPVFGNICGILGEIKKDGLYTIRNAMVIFIDHSSGEAMLGPITEVFTYGSTDMVLNTPYVVLPESNPITQAYYAKGSSASRKTQLVSRQARSPRTWLEEQILKLQGYETSASLPPTLNTFERLLKELA